MKDQSELSSRFNSFDWLQHLHTMKNTKHRDIPSHKTWNAPFAVKSLTLAMIDEVRFERPHITALAIAPNSKRDDDTINPSLNWPDGVWVNTVLLLVQRSSTVRELNVGVRIYRPDRSICRRFFRWCLDHVLYFYCWRQCYCCKLWIMSKVCTWNPLVHVSGIFFVHVS